MATKRSKRRCKAKTKAGKRCRNGAAVDGVCLAHAPRKVKEERGFGGPQEGSGRPRKPRPDDILRQKLDEEIDRYLAVIDAAIGAGKPLQMWDAHEGKHRVEFVADPALGLKALKFLFDRAYGRPRQQLELAGAGEEAPLRISADLLTDPDLREDLRALRRRVADARPERPVGAGAGDRPAEDG